MTEKQKEIILMAFDQAGTEAVCNYYRWYMSLVKDYMDNTIIISENEDERNSRLTLCEKTNEIISLLGDFNKIVINK